MINLLNFHLDGGTTDRMKEMIAASKKDVEASIVELDLRCTESLQNKKLIVALECDIVGSNSRLNAWLENLYRVREASGDNPLEGTTAVLLVNSKSRLYTKRLAQFAIFHMNRLGCRFIGHSMVEAVHELQNFKTWQKVSGTDLGEILLEKCMVLGKRLMDFDLNSKQFSKAYPPKLLVLHSSSHKTSNTLMLSKLVTEQLEDFDIEEYHIEDDKIAECKGCSFKTCMHYSEMKSCYYGGLMVEKILPAIEEADGIIWVCPNYNDALSAKLMAVINRMTVLYRRVSFYEKRIYGIFVSGNSGSDLVMTQLLGALNINKGFMLPPQFALHAIANDPGAVHTVENIEQKAFRYAMQIEKEFFGQKEKMLSYNCNEIKC